MNGDPCKQLYDEYIKAMNEWVTASNATRIYAVVKPLNPNEDITPLTLEKTQEMFAAYDREEKARKTYFEKVNAYFECRQLYRV